MSNFSINTLTYDRLRISITGGGGNITFRIDDIELQGPTIVQPVSNRIRSINKQTQQDQRLLVGSDGTDFNIASADGNHTFHLPTVSATNRGVLAPTAATFSPDGSIEAQAVSLLSEITGTPTGTTQAVNLTLGNHQTLNLASSTGNVTATITPPAGSSAGTIVLIQHATARDITWAITSGTILWDAEPDWDGDDGGAIRIIAWRWDGTRFFLSATRVFE